MRQQEITIQQLQPFAQHLEREERSAGTVEKYLRDVRRFFLWLDGKEVNRAALSGWKRHLQQQRYAPATINSMLAAVNAFLRYLGREDCRVRLLRIQRQIFRARERELTRREYDQLVLTARRSGQERLALVLETVCATGIRISELRYITVEAARYGRAEISLKGKSVSFSCRESCVGSCGNMQRNREPPPGRSFSPEAAAGWAENRCGRK